MRTGCAIAAMLLVFGAPARGDFRVGDTKDVVYLVDGSTIEGTVIAVGIRAVVIVVKGKEEGEAEQKIIARTKVERIERGEAAKETSSFKTDTIDGTKAVTGQGFRDESAEPAAPAKPGEKKAPGTTVPVDKNLRKKIEQAMGSNPLIQKLVKDAGGVDNAVKMLQNNPTLLNRLDDYIRRGADPGGGRAPGAGRGQGNRRPGGRGQAGRGEERARALKN